MAKRTVAAILKDARPATSTVRVCMRGDLIDRLEQLVAELDEHRARSNGKAERLAGDPDARRLAQQIEELQEQVKAAEEPFTFSAVGDENWTRLQRDNQPTDEQKQMLKDQGVDGIPAWNPETFPLLAMAASAVDPQMTADDAKQLREFLNFSQWQKLWGGVLRVNLSERDTVPFNELAFALIHGSGTKPEQPEPTETPGPSS